MSEIQVGQDILASDMGDNGSFSVQLGDSVTLAVTSEGAEFWGPPGFASRPPKATPGTGACQAVTVARGDRDVIIATRDTRFQKLYGNLNEGETCMYGGGAEGTSQARVVIKDSGAITLFTTDTNDHDGNGVYLRIDKEKLAFKAPWGTVVFDKTGFHIITQSGATFDLGGMAGATPNYCRIGASLVNIDAPITNIGPSVLNGGTGVFLAPVIAPIASVEPFTPTPIGAGIGVTLGISSTSVFFGV